MSGPFGPGGQFSAGGPGWGGEGASGDRMIYSVDESGIVLAHEGEMDERNPDEHLPGTIDLGGGIKLRINPYYFRMIMHTPEITAMVDARCEELTAEANSLKVRDGAEYVYTVSNNPDNIRARGRVRPGNIEAILDDDENATLLKALATVGSDPLPPSYFTNVTNYQTYLDFHADFHSELAQPEAGPQDLGDAE